MAMQERSTSYQVYTFVFFYISFIFISPLYYNHDYSFRQYLDMLQIVIRLSVHICDKMLPKLQTY